jgi:hypothetical protein
LEFALKNSVGFRDFIGTLKFQQRDHQRFGDIPAAVGAEASGNGSGYGELRSHATTIVAYESNVEKFGEAIKKKGTETKKEPD